MGRSHGFGSTACDYDALITLAFAVAPAATALANHRPLLAGSYSKRHAVRGLAPSHGLSAHGFRIYFTPLAGVLFTVPSRYCALSVCSGTSPWGGGRPRFRQDITCPDVLEMAPQGAHTFSYGTLTHSGLVFQASSLSLCSCLLY